METSLLNQLKFSWKFSKPYKGALLLYLVTQLIGITLSLLFIWYSKQAIDLAVSSDSAELYHQLIYASCCLIGSFVLGIFGYRLNEKTRISMLVDLQKQVLQGQMLSSWKNSTDWHTGDLLVRTNTDSNEIVEVLGNVIISVIVTLVRIIGAAGLLWWMDPMLAIILLCVSPLVLFSKIYLKKLKKLNQELKKSESSLGETMQENLRMRLFIRAINLENKRWGEIEKKQNHIYD
ncbi:MAG: ABC transporter transmembrane domain-containing protein, partial [Sphingobacterium sp.]